MKKIPLSEPVFDSIEKKYLLNCLRTGFLSSVGSNIEKFEKKISKVTKVSNCVACINGTSALHIALKVLGLNEKDEVIVPTMSFIATLNPVLYLGAKPIFMDCDKFLNIDTDKTIKFLNNETYFKNGFTYNKRTKKIIKVIIVAHMYGNLCNVFRLKKICKKKNIKILEDAAESLGSNDKKGSYKYSDISCFSFNGNKIITAGGGGAIVSNNKKYINQARHLVNQARINSLEYFHNCVGYNYRISNLHAAIGISQLGKIKKFLKKKKQIHNFYIKKIANNKNFEIIRNNQNTNSNNWINILKIKNSNISFLKVINCLKKYNIECRPIWFPLHLQKYCKKFQKYEIKNSLILYKTSVCLPSSVSLKLSDINHIVKILYKIK